MKVIALAILHKLRGEIEFLDLEDQNCMTFDHYNRYAQKVDYCYFKKFEGHI